LRSRVLPILAFAGLAANEVVAALHIGDGGGVDIQLVCWSKFLEV
jgi:hypothetical protein